MPQLESLEDRLLLAVDPIVVDTVADVVDVADGLTSLREAIQMANAESGADVITFNFALANMPINLNLGELTISDALTIAGLGAE